RALTLGREAVELAERAGDQMYISRGLTALGHAQLVAGDADGAVRSLRRVRDLENGLGITDPARGRWHGDLAEALVRIGGTDEAQQLLDVAREPALPRQRAWKGWPRWTARSPHSSWRARPTGRSPRGCSSA